MSTFRFGQPWHGRFSPEGLLLANGTLRTEWPAIQPFSHFTYYADFDRPDAPSSNAVEAAAGMVWKKDIVFSARGKYYHPSGALGLSASSWVYKCNDGTVYKLTVFYSSTTGLGQVSAVKLGEVNQITIASFSLTGSPNTTAQQFMDINASPRGDKAMLNVGRTITGYTSASVAYTRVNYVYAMAEFVLSGGSASSLPSCTTEVLCEPATRIADETWTNPDNHSSASGEPMDYLVESRTTYTVFIAGGYNKAGQRVVIKARNTFWSYEYKFGPTYYTYQRIGRASAHNDVLVNDSAVYFSPEYYRSLVREIDNNTVVITEDITQNADYGTAIFQVVYLSNCLFGFGMPIGGDGWALMHIRSFFGETGQSLYGSRWGGTDLDTITVAAFDPRSETVLSGIGNGFI